MERNPPRERLATRAVIHSCLSGCVRRVNLLPFDVPLVELHGLGSQ